VTWLCSTSLDGFWGYANGTKFQHCKEDYPRCLDAAEEAEKAEKAEKERASAEAALATAAEEGQVATTKVGEAGAEANARDAPCVAEQLKALSEAPGAEKEGVFAAIATSSPACVECIRMCASGEREAEGTACVSSCGNAGAADGADVPIPIQMNVCSPVTPLWSHCRVWRRC
jgi:hypothetical protein